MDTFCQISQGAVSDYQMLISFGLFIDSICFSGFDPEKSYFHLLAKNLNGFPSFDG